MHQKLSKLDRISVMNNLLHQFYESDHVLDFFPTLTTKRLQLCKVGQGQQTSLEILGILLTLKTYSKETCCHGHEEIISNFSTK